MLVVDTSAWIEMLLGSAVGLRFQGQFEKQDEIIVPTMVQYELSKWATREGGSTKADEVVAFSSGHTVVEFDTATAVLASSLSVDHKLHATDAIIYATAQIYETILLTCDAHFEGLPGVEYLPKTV